MPPWGGFGRKLNAIHRNFLIVQAAVLTHLAVGLNRLVQGYLGLNDIRETVLFPRDACRLAP